MYCFIGPPGLGKTTLASIISNELNVNLRVTSGPVLDKPGDLAGLLTNLQEGDVLFIDEIHRLSPVVEEYLYSAMEDFQIDIMIDKGPSARSVQLSLNNFTLIGATTRSGLLDKSFTGKIRNKFHLEYYDQEILTGIVTRSAGILKVKIETEAAVEIAGRSRGTPRIANALLRRIRDFAQVKGSGIIDLDITRYGLKALNIDQHGLDEMDNRILSVIIDKFNGGPVGLNTISTAVGEESGTIEEVYEPFLIKEGYLKRTPRGREATEHAYKHLGNSLDSNIADGISLIRSKSISNTLLIFSRPLVLMIFILRPLSSTSLSDLNSDKSLITDSVAVPTILASSSRVSDIFRNC